MLTFTFKLQADSKRRELNMLQFEQTMICREQEKATERIADFEAEADGDKDMLAELKATDEYAALEAYASAMEERSASIDTQIQLLSDDIDAFDKQTQNGVESNTSFWCFGG